MRAGVSVTSFSILNIKQSYYYTNSFFQREVYIYTESAADVFQVAIYFTYLLAAGCNLTLNKCNIKFMDTLKNY